MSKISILDIATLNQADSFLTELSETELQISGGGHCYGRGSKNKGSKNKGSRKHGGSGSGKKNSGKKNSGRGNCHPCW